MIIIRCVLWISWLSFSYYSRRQPKGLSYYVSNDSMLTYMVSQFKSIVLNRHSDTVMVTVTVEYWIMLWKWRKFRSLNLRWNWWMWIRRLVGKRFNTKNKKTEGSKTPSVFPFDSSIFARSMMFVGYKVFYYISDNYGYY